VGLCVAALCEEAVRALALIEAQCPLSTQSRHSVAV
jgi:hypothetical protein